LKAKPTKTILIKNEKPATLKSTLTKSLDLLPSLQSQPTITALLLTMAFTALLDTIIKAGVSMIRAMGEKDWPERTRN
jgi:hypothetical protein